MSLWVGDFIGCCMGDDRWKWCGYRPAAVGGVVGAIGGEGSFCREAVSRHTQSFFVTSWQNIMSNQHNQHLLISKIIFFYQTTLSITLFYRFLIQLKRPLPTQKHYLQLNSKMVRFILSIIILVTFVCSRHFETSFKFSLLGRNKGWVYVDKMTFAPGIASVELDTFTTGKPYGRDSELFLQAVSEQKWENQSLQRCNSSVRMPLAVHALKLNGESTSSTFSFRVEDYTTYYFVIKDCQSRFIADYNNENLLLKVKMHLLNNDREVGEQQDHWYIVPFIIIAGMLLLNYYMQEFKTAGPRDPDWSKMLLFIGTVSQISSLFWKSIGFVIYSWTGSDYFFFHLIYLLLHSTSEAAIVGLITLIGFGWTLTFSYGKHFEIFLPLVGCLAFINIIITMITKLGHEHDRHHLFDSVGGGILIGFRVILALVFLGGAIYTYRKVRINLKRFMAKFIVLGLIYIASMPMIVWYANSNVAARNRHEFVFISIEVLKFVTNLVLGYEMNVEESEYNRVNYKNASFLPDDEKGF